MILTNQKIYSNASDLAALDLHDIKMPVRINFFLQKNIQTLVVAAQEIETARLGIAQTFGELDEEKGTYIVPTEKLAAAQQELTDLFNLEQNLNIHIFKLDDFDGIELTYQQLSAIMFMIEE